jgi:2-polyprenyl-6-methoxyphenol hydroxylase-like FAD-dependent oxidoreductase
MTAEGGRREPDGGCQVAVDAADVLIAGAGPAGLLLAADLAAAGVRVTVLACAQEAGDGHAANGSVAVHARTLEHLDALGTADALIGTGTPTGQVIVYPEVTIDLAGLPTRFPFALITRRYEIERTLADQAASLGARLVGAPRIADISQQASGTLVRFGGPGAAIRSVAAPYLVGTGPAGSAVHAALGRQPSGFDHGRVIVTESAESAAQDVNAGLHDAANLGWRLAAVLRWGAGAGLLRGYHTERRQAARQRARIDRLLLLPSRPEFRLLARLLTTATSASARRGIAADLAARAVSGLSYRYRPSGRPHRLAGRRAPDAVLSGRPGRLYEALRERRFVLMVSDDLRASTELPPLLALWPEQVAVVATRSPPALLTLVRPDGHIGWASDSASPARRYAELRQVLGECCGPPAVSAPGPAVR